MVIPALLGYRAKLELLERHDAVARKCSCPSVKTLASTLLFCVASPSLTDLRSKSQAHAQRRQRSFSYVGTCLI